MKRCFWLALIFIIPSISLSAEDTQPIITVLDFQTNNVSEGDMKSIISLLSSALFNTEKYKVIDISQRETILAELEFSARDCTDESCQLEIGKLLSAEMIVVGNIGRVGDRYLLTAKILETETGATLDSADGVYPDLNNLIDSIYPFVERLSGTETDVAVVPEPEEAEAETATIEPAESPSDEQLPGQFDVTPAPVNAKRIAAFSCLGAGTVAAGIGTYFFIRAVDFRRNTVDPSYDEYNSGADYYDGDFDDLSKQEKEDYFTDLYDTYSANLARNKRQVILGTVLVGGGAALIGTSIVLFLLPDKAAGKMAAGRSGFFLTFQPVADSTTGLTLHYRY